MLCDKCKKNEAKIYYTEIIQGEKKEQHLCEECATEFTSFHFGKSLMNQDMNLGNLLSTILGSNIYTKGNNEPVEKELHCSTCGMTQGEFLKVGRFGCEHCYDIFYKILDKSIKNIQGSELHTGKKPKGFQTATEKLVMELSETQRLSLLLQDAVEKEEYEEAARIRDRIRELKSEEANNA